MRAAQMLAAFAVTCLLCNCVSAQYGGYGNYAGMPGLTGIDGNQCCGNNRDPRVGYCLNNDCFCRDGNNGNCGGGCGGGMRVTVRVRVGGPGNPWVDYPVRPDGSGIYRTGQLTKEQLYREIAAAQNTASGRPANKIPVRRAGYRYRF